MNERTPRFRIPGPKRPAGSKIARRVVTKTLGVNAPQAGAWRADPRNRA